MNTGYRLSRNDQERNTEMMTYSVGFQLMAHMAQEMSNPFSYQFPQFLYPMGEQDSREGPKFTSDCGFQKRKGAI